jgi:DNA helicase HerA-like ATPase
VPDATDKLTYIGENIEQPANFYLGREYDLAQKKTLDKAVMYDARDLTTHGVVVGMTGSGKTGLCINLLEEAAIDGIPCIIVDLKGDLVNLLLQFEDLKAEDFQKWINPEDARLKGVPLAEYAQQTADKWRQGLAEWGQTPERVKLLKDAADRRIYTPGSEAGLPLSILGTFTAPSRPMPSPDGKGIVQASVPREELNQKIESTATALLGLTGTSADPVQSREHILISQLLLYHWSKGKDLDLAQLILAIQ